MTQDIDWHQQWALHGKNFYNGAVHIDFQELGLQKESWWRKELLLLRPGAGFGDFSHPTTRLVLKMMATHVKDQTVIDMGCGSGILSLAAASFGASHIVGIDIEEEAVVHARENSLLNTLQSYCFFSKQLPSLPSKSSLLLMNMIRSEQQIAHESIQHLPFSHIFTSGVLVEERSLYLLQAKSYGWKLLDEQEEEEWLGFHFQKVCIT